MAFDFYFAGTQHPDTEKLFVELGANVLKSYVNDKKIIQRYFEYKKNGWTGKLLIDSGAFTVHRQGGELDIDRYIEWLNENDNYIDYAIEADHIPGKWGQPRTREEVLIAPKISYENYIYMRNKMKSPHKLLPVFHQYESFEWLNKILETPGCEYICLSGNKELTNKQREQWYSKCYSYINKLKPTVKVHCLGSATIQNAEKFPFTSMDATSWIMTGANGGIFTEVGVIEIGNKSSLTKQETEILNKLLKKYGYTLQQAQEDYRIRMLINIHYLHEKSNTTSFRGTLTFKRRLF